MKKSWSPNYMRIIDIYNKIKSKELSTRPYYQRKLVWTLKDKDTFIETILKGYPFPEVYFCHGEFDTKTLTVKQFVVDGQQRLTTIVDYIDGKIDVKLVPAFRDLSESDKKEFLNYKVIVRDLEKISEEEIKEVFNRLNKTDYTLNAIELLYAMYQGDYISIGKKIVSENDRFFDAIIGEKSISRMNDLDFILQIMTTVEHGIYFSGAKEIEEYVKMYNEEYKNGSKMYELITRNLKMFIELDLKKDSLFLKKAASFSLLVELCKLNYDKENISISELHAKVIDFEQCLILNKEKDMETNEYAKFYNYLYQATASKSARDFRGKMLANLLTK